MDSDDDVTGGELRVNKYSTTGAQISPRDQHSSSTQTSASVTDVATLVDEFLTDDNDKKVIP